MNIAEILKGCPRGTKLYSPVHGEVWYLYIDNTSKYPIVTETTSNLNATFTLDGRVNDSYDGECMLFPSKENRDWSTFKIPKKEYNFKPFDKVLVRDSDDNPWNINLFSFITPDYIFKYNCLYNSWRQCIPYEGNEHLLNTTEKP